MFLNGSGSFVLFLSLFVTSIESVRRLNEYIRHYEPLSYDTHKIHQKHMKIKRSIDQDNILKIKFYAHGRDFHLRLTRDVDTFSKDLSVLGPFNSSKDIDTSHIYQGHLIDEPDSYVFGSVDNGVFHGKIVSTHDGGWYVEKSHYYFPQHRRKKDNSFHSVIYHEADVEDPYEPLRTGDSSGCGITNEVVDWMERIQNSAEPETLSEPKTHIISHGAELYAERPEHKYSIEANTPSKNHWTRMKRTTRPKEDTNKKNTCSLFIQTDPLIWRHVFEQLNHDEEKTREEILSLIAHHVTAVNYIYRDTKFDGKIEHRNIKFEVQRIKIDDDSACGQPQSYSDQNPFCMENIDVSNFLNLHSLGNHEDFCLAYVFTYRDFTGGTLGLAWVASASGASGGICERYKTYTETVGGMYQSTKRSLNTGIITFVNYNSRVPPKVSQLTLAHEIGHNFGSPHDFPNDCKPGGLSGNYIMFASATSGDRPNNSKFSKCSIGNISNVLDAIVDNKKRNCFNASAGAFCGNKIVEAGEECDCGYDDDECQDKCCYPRQLSVLERIKNQTAKGCTRKQGTQCSPSQGPCCSSETCSFVPLSENVQCKAESDCSYNSLCNGRSSECPPPQPKADKTRCNEGTQLCIKGECTGSICLEWNLTECFLTSTGSTSSSDKRKLCELACQNGTDTSTCRSTSEFAHLVNLSKGGISLRPGSPCDNFQGYCDVFLRCRAVDAEGPLARLKNMLFNQTTLSNLKEWMTEHWWAVLLMGIIFIIFMGAFIKCCAVHTPSSNPKKPPARHIGETLRRPMNTLRRMRYGGGHHRNVPRQGNHSRVSTHAYAEPRASLYYPKASAPHSHASAAGPSSSLNPAPSGAEGYSRSGGKPIHGLNPELYAEAYSDASCRSSAYEMRHHKV